MKTIFFDYHGVVGKWDEEILFSNISTMFNLDEEKIHKLFYNNKLLNEIEKGNKNSMQLLEELNMISNKSITLNEFKQVLNGVYYDNNEIVNFIKSIKTRYRLFVTQNAMDLDEEYQFKNLHSFKIFDKIYSSCKLNTRKDNILFFKQIIDENNLKIDDIIYFDDIKKYVDTAKTLGIKAYVFENLEQIKGLLNEK
jgi:FMN phosphatase YigB (HAD superfamily)